MNDGSSLTSAFASHIGAFVAMKRSDGYRYDSEERVLERFDSFAAERFPGETAVTRDMFLAWSEKTGSEGDAGRRRRAGVVRQFSIYLNSVGVESHIPHDRFSAGKPRAKVMTREELRAFFAELDKGRGLACWSRFDMEYQVLFRLCYCCGLRLDEACGLRWADVDTASSTLSILDAKGHRDRIVYMSDDLNALVRDYSERLGTLSLRDEWVFPGREAGTRLPKTSVCRVFRRTWERTAYAGMSSKRPTTHSLRHGFVVDRMNEWMLEGADLSAKTPYLSMYLGHASVDETFYYYHQANKAYRVIRERDVASGSVIPEVEP